MNLSNIDFFRVYIESNIPDLNGSLFHNILNNKQLSSSPEGLPFNNSSFIQANLNNCLFHRSNLTNCDFSNSSAINANFSGANLTNVNFEGADLTGAIFCGADLSGVNFNEAIIENASFRRCIIDRTAFKNTLGRSVTMNCCSISYSSFTNSDFRHSSFYLSTILDTSFSKSWLNYSNLARIKAERTEFKEVSLTNSNLKFAIISESSFLESAINDSNLNGSEIENCTFSSLSLNNSYFSDCSVQKSLFITCSFNGSNIRSTSFNETSFENTDFVNAVFSYNTISDCKMIDSNFQSSIFQGTNLSPFLNLHQKHLGSCSIDHQSIALTLDVMRIHPLELNPAPNLIKFMENCGTPTISAMYAIDSIRSLQPNQLDTLMRSTFISYGAPDEKFAQKLNQDLKKNGVTTFFFPESASFGQKLHSMMRGINKYDRIILICSKQSLSRSKSGILYEIEKTLEREAKEGGESYLIPVRLDDYVLNEWKPTLEYMKEEVLNRVVADFTDEQVYDQQLNRLLNALKKKQAFNQNI